MKFTLIFFIIYLLLGALVVYLQIYFSKMKSRWIGLILPGLTLIYSIIIVLNIVEPSVDISTTQRIAMVLSAFITSNIPTIILLAIYAAVRQKLKRKSEIDKMNIKDL
ncbi:hypothetical protein [Peptoniphilus sp. BV3AC2]|uniref:hypothetical protein n=1 Tax=Peptoniphilus sp. BV3AC2 TaxID=1111133 RepID=UPI0003B89500|nr:hypothetical protein [Peptoniphilus sp. BV3AC2]ERT64735.1 hypothetical protein HMPREF1252_1827 [Peptoniphilus sp. BV3AC2]